MKKAIVVLGVLCAVFAGGYFCAKQVGDQT